MYKYPRNLPKRKDMYMYNFTRRGWAIFYAHFAQHFISFKLRIFATPPTLPWEKKLTDIQYSVERLYRDNKTKNKQIKQIIFLSLLVIIKMLFRTFLTFFVFYTEITTGNERMWFESFFVAALLSISDFVCLSIIHYAVIFNEYWLQL